MNDSNNAALDAMANLSKGIWQAFIIPIGITAWAIYRDIVSKRGRRRATEQVSRQRRVIEHDQHAAELSARHQEYIRRIESDFQEMCKQLQDTEAETTILRREKWQAELNVRAWRHACRDAQQIVWALQRQGCAAGSELTRFKPVDPASLQSSGPIQRDLARDV